MTAKRAVPRRALFGLGVAVLAAHFVVLQAAPGAFNFGEPRAKPVPITARAVLVEAAAAPALAPEAPPVVATARPVAHSLPAKRPAVLRSSDATPVAQVRPESSEPPARAVAPPAAANPPSAQRPAAFAIPGSVRLRYKVTATYRGQTLNANGELVWRHDGETYDAKLEVTHPFLPTRTQRSAGRVGSEGLAPERFSDKARNEEAAHFERDKGTISFSSNRPAAPLLPGAQDRLSVMLQLGAMLAADPSKFPAGTTVTIQTAGAREAEPWVFTVEGAEELQLPGGKVPAVKLIRLPRKEFDVKVELWLAPGMDYVPVRLRLTQPNADWVDQQWSSTDRG